MSSARHRPECMNGTSGPCGEDHANRHLRLRGRARTRKRGTQYDSHDKPVYGLITEAFPASLVNDISVFLVGTGSSE
jgi:hypothetical protein